MNQDVRRGTRCGSVPRAKLLVSIVVVVEAALVTLKSKLTAHGVLCDLPGPPGGALHRRAPVQSAPNTCVRVVVVDFVERVVVRARNHGPPGDLGACARERDRKGRAYYFLGDYEQARVNLEQALARNADNVEARVYLAAVLGQLGDREGAAWQADEIRVIEPTFNVSRWLSTYPMTDKRQEERLAQALLAFGL